MKSLIKKIYNSDISIIIRNSLNFKPVIMNRKLQGYSSVSDAFAWRTDNSYITKFKFTDILALYDLEKNSKVKFEFYSNDNQLIRSLEINNLDYSNEIIIDQKFLNGIQDYGVFYIYHYSKKNITDSVISNRCYLGYSYKNNLYSFVHGNCYARYYNFDDNKITSNIIKTSLFKNHYYKIQKYFHNYDFLELFFVNPTSKTIYFSIGKLNFKIKSGCSKIIKLIDKDAITMKSNCMFLRPTIFQYKNNYLDVHHS